MNIVIVDDEAQIRRWMGILLDQTGLPVQLVASCSNGQEALEACRKLDVDVVMTDIKMPVMDGIAFIRELKQERPSIVSLILSSYSEFQYASEAIRAGAADYMLKAEVTAHDLRRVLEKLKADIERERLRDREVLHLKSAINVNQYALRSLFFSELARGKKISSAELEEKLRTLRIPLRSQHVLAMIIRSDDPALSKDKVKIQDPELLRSAVINMTDELLLTEAGGGCCFVFEQDYFAALFNFEQRGERTLRDTTLQYAQRISSSLQELLGLSVSIGVSLPALHLSSLGQQLEEARSALNRKRFYGRKTISWHSDEAPKPGFALDSSVQHTLELLSELLDQNRFNRVLPALKETLNEAGTKMLWSEKESKAFALEAVFLLQRTFRRLSAATGDRGDNAAAPDGHSPHEEISRQPTFQHLADWLLARAERIVSEAELLQHPYSETIRKVCDYVKRHYADGASLQQAADYVHLNKNYLSELFKKETGSSYNDYVTLVRIEKIKTLLLEGKAPVGQLPEMVGYPDGSYLSKVFKKVTGMTPLEFKRKKA
ncbi:response regulator [Paenibacillus pasadenensis]|uniref:response regulator n=1 Tax=Paenibacillus pasadenensis TaxID=217090 RepID=UPI00203C72A1|nr:response regulator [Paenibacillus pasadenensis]MCM3747828.1 response regulator [Paenibacillus pasadenensis]